MKYVKFPLSVINDSRLSANDMRVLAWLIYRSNRNPNNICWPSVRTISKDTGIHQKKISGHTKRLVDFGWIEKIPRGKGGVGNNQNYHVISTPTLGDKEVPPFGGCEDPHSGTPNTPTSGEYTPIYEIEKEIENEKRDKSKKFLNIKSLEKSREYSAAEIKNSQANKRQILKLEKQQEHASA